MTAFAQETGSAVSIEAFPESPIIGTQWQLLLIVDHDAPDEVTVTAPPFFDYFFLDLVTKTPRVLDAQIKTAIEYILIPNAVGIISLEPFTVNTPEGVSKTPAIVVNVRSKDGGAAIKPILFRLVWENAPRQMAAGEQAVFSLRVTDDASLPPAQTVGSMFPPQEFFMPEVPRGAIFKSVKLQEAERAGGIVTKVALIPLDRDFNLPARVIRHENIVFEIPALHIRVTDTRHDAR